MIQQGTLTVLYRQTSFGTFGGGDAISCNILAHTCCTSGAPNCDKSTGDGSGGKSGPPGSTTAPGGNAVPGGIGGSGIPPGSNTVPGWQPHPRRQRQPRRRRRRRRHVSGLVYQPHRPRCDRGFAGTERCGGVEEREHRHGRGPGEDHLLHTATLTPTVG